jgi:hypothetical protein
MTDDVAGKLRSGLREYYPAFLAAFGGLASREARATCAWHPLRPGRLEAAGPPKARQALIGP